MKKYLSVLFLIALIIPSFALASWWNPFSWKVFHRKEVAPQTQIINTEQVNNSKEEIEKLQKEINDLKNKQQENVSDKTNPKAKELKKTAPAIDNSAKIKAEAEARVEADAVSKLKAEQDALLLKEKSEQNALIAKQKTEQDKIIAEQKAKLEVEEKRKNSPECKNATALLEKIKQEIEPVENQINSERDNYLQNGNNGYSLSNESLSLNSKYTDLLLRKRGIEDKYYAVCENYYPTYTPSNNTTCYFIGNILTCY